MIEYTHKSIFDFPEADVLVNPVNCMGVMGAGLAKEFKRRFPTYFDEYQKACLMDRLQLETLHYYTHKRRDGSIVKLVSFPTKYHWKDKSQASSIAAGLFRFSQELEDFKCAVFPALGCGLGGLDWEVVKPLFDRQFAGTQQRVIVCLPKG